MKEVLVTKSKSEYAPMSSRTFSYSLNLLLPLNSLTLSFLVDVVRFLCSANIFKLSIIHTTTVYYLQRVKLHSKHLFAYRCLNKPEEVGILLRAEKKVQWGKVLCVQVLILRTYKKKKRQIVLTSPLLDKGKLVDQLVYSIQ